MSARIGVALVSLGLLAGCGGEPAADKGKSGRHGLVYTVDVLPVEAKKVDYIVTAPGTIDAFERVQVTARVAGAVDKVLFTEGQSVKRGTKLVVIDGERYALALAQAKAAVEKAKATENDAQAMVTRREGATTEHPGLIPGEELSTYRTHVLTAKADTEVAVQAAKTAEINLRDSTVTAPIDGVIQTRTVETGQYVPVGYIMATLLRSDPMLLHFSVEPDDAPRIQPGMKANFTMRETNRTYDANITLVSASADASTHMVSITGEVNDKEHKFWLRPGSFCEVTIDLNATRDAPLIPRSAARATDHGYVGYVIKGDVADERQLNLGMSTKDGWIEVRSGIAAGDLLVVRGAEPLEKGSKVHANTVTAASINSGTPPPENPSPPDGGAHHGRGQQ